MKATVVLARVDRLFTTGRPINRVLAFLIMAGFLLSLLAMHAAAADADHHPTSNFPVASAGAEYPSEAGLTAAGRDTEPGKGMGSMAEGCEFLGLLCVFGFVAIVGLRMARIVLLRSGIALLPLSGGAMRASRRGFSIDLPPPVMRSFRELSVIRV